MKNGLAAAGAATLATELLTRGAPALAQNAGSSMEPIGLLGTPKEKEMKISQTYRAALIAIHTIDSAPKKPKSALRGLMQRLGLGFLACTLVIGATGSASAGEARDEVSVRALGDTFAKPTLRQAPTNALDPARRPPAFTDKNQSSE